MLPIEFDPATKKLIVAMASHENFRALDDLRMHYGYNVTPMLADPETLEKLINKYYNTAAESLGDILSELELRRRAEGPQGPRRVDRPRTASRTPPTPTPSAS